ncbi:DNA-binding protein [Acinetobacter haemolyticus]|uniref:DNA-binding protein n=1 Tax=Acinetobacter haemolyticus TaxID=29430 RepID=UPI000DE8C915|nr:DNA-binding protein [Acinetobacter haemolyticus]WHR58734.1 DNA-binding protein [Acinetobacter haemolyticus]
MKTAKQVREDFDARGKTIAEWARENNFSAHTVYQVLLSNRIPRRGKSHEIAVKLGLKEGEVNE